MDLILAQPHDMSHVEFLDVYKITIRDTAKYYLFYSCFSSLPFVDQLFLIVNISLCDNIHSTIFDSLDFAAAT